MMNRQRRSSIILGILLVLAGAWFLAQQFYPQLRLWTYFNFSWPWYVIGAGLILFLLSLLLAAPGLVIPATIVTGIGFLLYWQNENDNWESWSYVWTLIPGFVGVGIFLSELISGNFRKGLREGGSLIVISGILFAIFGAFLGGSRVLGNYWPVLLILIGVWFMIQPFLDKGSNKI
jgi:hypothetical protein